MSLILNSLVFLGSLAFLGLGLLLWFLVRTQWRKVWMPILRVLELENSQVQRIKRESPPLIPFFLFLITGLVFLFFAMRPKVLTRQPITQSQTKVHLFLDMNASLQASTTLSDYVHTVERLWNELSSYSKITISTSHNASVWTPKNLEEIKEKIYNLGFHRGGVDLASAIKQQRELIGSLDGLWIVSDGSRLGWQNFNWNFLTEEMKVYWTPVTSHPISRDNIYFRDVQVFSAPYTPTLEWVVDLERSGVQHAKRGGIVKVVYGANTLGSAPFRFEEDILKTEVRMSVSSKMISQLNVGEGSELLWLLEPYEPDAMTIDDSFRTPFQSMRQDALLVGEPFGERSIEDPFYQLEKALQTFGFIPERVDRWIEPKRKHLSPLLVFSIDETANLQDSCPLSLANRRAKNYIEHKEDKFPVIWLSPKLAKGPMKNICQCFRRLMDSRAEPLTECDYALDAQKFNEILSTSGAQPVGAHISNLSSSTAWFKEDQDLTLKLVAFAIPLRPSRLNGLNHARFPLFIKDLLQWQGLVDESLFVKNSHREWPRPIDLSRFAEWKDGSFDMSLKESNVPVLASSLNLIPSQELPPQWDLQNIRSSQELFQKEEYEPGYWLSLIFMAMGALMILEGLWNVRRRFTRWVSFLFFSSVIFFLKTPPVFADLHLTVVGSPYKIELKGALKELPLRTSLEIEDSLVYLQADTKDLTEPWYWVRDKAFLLDKQGSLRKDLRYWLKRGGFLIVQGLDMDFAPLMNEAFASESPEATWKVIPPDHELLKSFYLINTLPTCHNKLWSGFEFDGRLAVLSIPYDFLQTLDSTDTLGTCEERLSSEYKTRLFINITMVALTTDYKADQIHMKEILKRLHER
jgi:hypothetical protein